MGSSRKKKANSGKPNNNSTNVASSPPTIIEATKSKSKVKIGVQSPETQTRQGEELARLISSIEKGRESARLVDPNLPYKIWLKQQFCVGVNDVTRALERMPLVSTSESSLGHPLSASDQAHRRKAPPVELQVILLASDCIPRWLTRHLPNLASSKKVPIIHVKDNRGGSLRLGELIKLRTAIAVGVKVRGNAINQGLEEILQSEEIKLTKLP